MTGCYRRPRFVVAFYDLEGGPARGVEHLGDPVAKIALCEGCAPLYKERMKARGVWPLHLPAREGIECGTEMPITPTA